jgi:hypothetical protein
MMKQGGQERYGVRLEFVHQSKHLCCKHMVYEMHYNWLTGKNLRKTIKVVTKHCEILKPH